MEEEDQSPPSPTSTDFEIISNYEDDIISVSSTFDESIDESSDEESDSDDENPVELLNDSDFLYSDSDDNQTIYDGDLPKSFRNSTSSEQQRSSDFLSDSNSLDNVQISGLCEPHNPNDWCSKCRPNWVHNTDDSNIKNLSISQFLFKSQKISHCSNCTLTWFNFKDGFEPVMNNDGLLLAKPVFLKPGSKSLPGIKLNVVALKNIGLTSSHDEIYFSDFSKCKSCIYESGHVLPYYGVTFHPDNLRYMIVMPYLPNRNFREYLKHPDNFKSFTWSRRLSMLHTLANELENLHKLGIIHKNLHPNNILIGKDIEDPIISEVGLMPQLPYKHSPDEYVVHGVLPYIDPMVISGSAFSPKSDVYSFAFIMWEVATCSLPYNDLPHNNKLAKKIVEGNRPYIPDHVPSFYAELIKMCWDAFPENRPGMREIAGIFNYWRNNITISGTNYGNYHSDRTNEHNNVYKEFQKADEFRLQDDCSSITRFSKLHIDAKFSSRFYTFKIPESIVVGNLYSHKQSVLSAPIRQHIIPDTGPLITPIIDSIYISPDQFSCNKCELNLDNRYWWCQTCETSRLRDKFGGWTSGNKYVDQYIQYTQTLAPSREGCLEWIPYSEFKNIKEIGKGGFSTVFHAIWKSGPMIKWNRYNQQYYRNGSVQVALKRLKDSQNIGSSFFQELIAHLHCESNCFVLRCYGITQDPVTKEYIMVTDYATEGDFRTYIRTEFRMLSWEKQISLLQSVAHGLKIIHEEGWIHRDLHSGNLLLSPSSTSEPIVIGDLGMCRPMRQINNSEITINGIIPYMAPELFKGKPYTKESDIYSFGTILWEASSGMLPFSNIPHNTKLVSQIRDGLRPELVEGTPNHYAELMWRCWDSDPSLRPNAAEVETILIALRCRSTEVIYHDEKSDSMYTGGFRHSGNGMYNHCNIHSQAIYESRCFKVTQLLKEIEKLSMVDDDLEQENNEIDSLLVDLKLD